MTSVFTGSLAPKGLGGSVAVLSVMIVTLLGFGFALLTSWLLARTVLRGQATIWNLRDRRCLADRNKQGTSGRHRSAASPKNHC